MEKIQQSKSSLLQSCGFRIDTDHHRVERDRYIFTAPFIINGILEKAVIAQTGKVLRQQADVLHVHQFFLACLGSIAVNPGFHTGFHPYDKTSSRSQKPNSSTRALQSHKEYSVVFSYF